MLNVLSTTLENLVTFVTRHVEFLHFWRKSSQICVDMNLPAVNRVRSESRKGAGSDVHERLYRHEPV
jgi:hypothetical protein